MRIAPSQPSDEAQLAELDRMLAVLPDATDLAFRRACVLEDLGWPEPASAAYATILEREPHHLGARTNLGLMLLERGELAAARTHLAAAVAAYPLAPIAHVNLAAALAQGAASGDALAHYRRALELDPDHVPAHHGLALLHEAGGDDAAAATHFQRAFAERAWWTLPFTGAGTPLRVVWLVSGRGGDVLAHAFLDPATVEATMLVPDGVAAGTPLPAHDVVFNGIGDADRCRRSLERADALLTGSPIPVINDPARVLRTTREAVAERLGALPNVVVPRIRRIARAALAPDALAADGWTFPLLVRAPGYHAGRHFAEVASPDALAGTLADLPGTDLYVIAFVDTRAADGTFRKYRALFVGGRMLPLHLAVSTDWKVHYFSSAMAESDVFRAEERRFLTDPRAALGPTAANALDAIGATLGLDYGGVDFGLDAAGRVVVFEANATMALTPPPPGERAAYRRPAYDAALTAVRELVAARGARARAQRTAPE